MTADDTSRPNGHVLKCIYTNADSLSNKMNELELMIEEINPDLIAITEVLPKQLNRNVNNFVLKGFTCVTVAEGRGVCLFVREGVEVTLLENYEFVHAVYSL